jgi:hypothetical protein
MRRSADAPLWSRLCVFALKRFPYLHGSVAARHHHRSHLGAGAKMKWGARPSRSPFATSHCEHSCKSVRRDADRRASDARAPHFHRPPPSGRAVLPRHPEFGLRSTAALPSATARRAGWVGCHFDLLRIPPVPPSFSSLLSAVCR